MRHTPAQATAGNRKPTTESDREIGLPASEIQGGTRGCEVVPLAFRGIEIDGRQHAGFGIDEAFAGVGPVRIGPAVAYRFVAPTLDRQRDDQEQPADDELRQEQCERTANQQRDGGDQQQDCTDHVERDRQHARQAFSITTAVPYATISLMVWPISDESKRIITTAFAPIACAFCTIRSVAWRRASSSIWVYSLISPPTIERNPAITLPPMPRLRTTRPNTWPLLSVIL